MKNDFRPKKFYDHEIVDEKNSVVGNIRVKPSGILWAPKNANVWYGVSIKQFGTFMEERGRRQKK